jgi:hypothetical protein
LALRLEALLKDTRLGLGLTLRTKRRRVKRHSRVARSPEMPMKRRRVSARWWARSATSAFPAQSTPKTERQASDGPLLTLKRRPMPKPCANVGVRQVTSGNLSALLRIDIATGPRSSAYLPLLSPKTLGKSARPQTKGPFFAQSDEARRVAGDIAWRQAEAGRERACSPETVGASVLHNDKWMQNKLQPDPGHAGASTDQRSQPH